MVTKTIPTDLDNITANLKQAGVDAVLLPEYSGPYICVGQLMPHDLSFTITLVPDIYIILGMSQQCQELIDALENIFGYRPFCRYVGSGQLVFEWNKVNETGRFAFLKSNPEVEQLQRINNS